jgi:hypothetical protein
VNASQEQVKQALATNSQASSPARPLSPTGGLALRVTPANYHRIQNGMTRGQVEEILGNGTYHISPRWDLPDYETFADPLPTPRPVIGVTFINGYVAGKDYVPVP